MIPDTVTLELRNTSSRYTLVESKKIYLNSTGAGNGSFSAAANGTPYYLVVKHHNAIETWSATVQSFTAGTLTYVFTTAANKAYDNNMKLMQGDVYAIFAGDVIKDGLIDGADFSDIDNANIASAR